ncbi:hypothetical protein B9Z55_022628 [Caenorhabditis nigoni]|uniref:Uncharacterized protein n=1 Tax=Caenorhabditis nigoni TaxID=1611254 RepID=A0A2G5SLS7_9PELO|nr:hypothetical protein B9Z55_022628 [Caenorhabditis nigoni]
MTVENWLKVFQANQALDMRRNGNVRVRALPQTVTPPRQALDDWHAVVKEALVAKGGTATLRQVNDYVKETFDLTNATNVERWIRKAVIKHMGRLWRPVDDYDEYDSRRHICLI